MSRIGTVPKNPLEMGTVSAASLAAFFLKRRDSVALGIYGDGLAYLPPDTGDKQYFKILSSLAGVKPEGSMPLQAVTNSLSGRFSRGSPVFIISSCEGDGTVPAAVRDLVGRGHEVTVLSPSSIDLSGSSHGFPGCPMKSSNWSVRIDLQHLQDLVHRLSTGCLTWICRKRLCRLGGIRWQVKSIHKAMYP